MSYDRGQRFHQVIGYEHIPENLLVNPGFEFWQRGTGSVSIAPNGRAFRADEWQATCGPSGGGTTTYQASLSPVSGSYAADVNYTGTDNANFMQGIECFNSLEGLTLTFSVWLKTSGSNVTVGIGDATSGGQDNTYVSHSGSGNWERLTVIRTIRTGLTTFGVWPHDYGLIVWVNTQGAARFYVDDAVLVVGNFLEGVPFVPLSRARDLARCQRYYQAGSLLYECPVTGCWSGFPLGEWVPPSGGGWAATKTVYFNTYMATTPTVTWSETSSHNMDYLTKSNTQSWFRITYDSSGAPGGSTDPQGYDPTFQGNWTAYVP